MAALSIRSLAARLNLSHATVSQSLRGSPKVKEATRRRVVEEAEQLGYRLDPVASELMARMRRSESHAFRGQIACILPESGHPPFPAQRERQVLMQEAARSRATALGFSIDFIEPSRSDEYWMRLPGVLNTRGVVGLLLFPSDRCQPADRARFCAEKYPVVQMDVPEEGAEHVDVVGPDYFHACALAIRRLAALGHRRPGLVLDDSSGFVVNSRWAGSCAAFQSTHGAAEASPPPLWIKDRNAPGAELVRWAKSHGIDAVVSPSEMACDPGLPFYSLDLPEGREAAMGLNLRWAEIASRSIDLIARKHFDRLCGRVESSALYSLPAFWLGTETNDRASLEAGSSSKDVPALLEQDA